MPSHFPRAAEAFLQGPRFLGGFQRILRGDQPPDLVEAEDAKGEQAYVAVPVMGRVERAAEQPDAKIWAPCPGRQMGASSARPQGRTCPSPSTTYL